MKMFTEISVWTWMLKENKLLCADCFRVCTCLCLDDFSSSLIRELVTYLLFLPVLEFRSVCFWGQYSLHWRSSSSILPFRTRGKETGRCLWNLLYSSKCCIWRIF